MILTFSNGAVDAYAMSEVSVSVQFMTGPLAPSDGAPPRQVEPWTQVTGHIVVADRPRAFCSCGDRAPRDWAGNGRDWRDAHLRQAWPELVPRIEDEPYGDWLTRIALEHSEALRIVSELDRPLREGEPIPVMTHEDTATADRLEVLEHQLIVVQGKALRSDSWD